MKSQWELHIELDRRMRKLRKRRQWWDFHGSKVRECVYLGAGLLIATLLALLSFCLRG